MNSGGQSGCMRQLSVGWWVMHSLVAWIAMYEISFVASVPSTLVPPTVRFSKFVYPAKKLAVFFDIVHAHSLYLSHRHSTSSRAVS